MWVVLREIELAVSVNKLKTRLASLRTASNFDFPKVSSGVRCGNVDSLDQAGLDCAKFRIKLLSSCWRYAHRK